MRKYTRKGPWLGAHVCAAGPSDSLSAKSHCVLRHVGAWITVIFVITERECRINSGARSRGIHLHCHCAVCSRAPCTSLSNHPHPLPYPTNSPSSFLYLFIISMSSLSSIVYSLLFVSVNFSILIL